MLNNSQARKIINDHVELFKVDHPVPIQLFNQPKFTVPSTGLWCRVTVQYANTQPSGLHRGLLERDFGIISIQCFARKGTGDVSLIALADAWRDHFKGFISSHLEVTLTNAPTEPENELNTDFVGCLVRIEFHVN